MTVWYRDTITSVAEPNKFFWRGAVSNVFVTDIAVPNTVRISVFK